LKGALKAMTGTRTAQLHLATSWPTGSMVFWIAVILGLFLLANVIH
jgi:multicomponent Na+:H+ antiporter subunit D